MKDSDEDTLPPVDVFVRAPFGCLPSASGGNTPQAPDRAMALTEQVRFEKFIQKKGGTLIMNYID